MEGVLRGTTVEDLAGQKIRITSSANKPLVENPSGLRIAMLDLDGIRVEQDMARIVSEMIRNRFAALSGLVLVDRTRMAQVVAEQNIQFSDRTDSATAVRLGRILNVQKIVMGSLSQLGSNFSISVQLIDVETARIDGIREVLCQRCSIDDMPAAVAALQGALIGN